MDTYTHINYFCEKYHISPKNFNRILVGARNDIFFPRENVKTFRDKFTIGFWSTYIPLHGIEFILKSAKILENNKDIRFVLIGKGQTYNKNRLLASELGLDNVNFIGMQSLEGLAKLISQFDIGLGIFGSSDKTQQVIPNKIFHGIAMKIPIITCESPAIKELFRNNENILLCKPANPESLAKAILTLKNNAEHREKIQENAFMIYNSYCTVEIISKELLNALNSYIK